MFGRLAEAVFRAAHYFFSPGDPYWVRRSKETLANTVDTLTIVFPGTLDIRDFYIVLTQDDAQILELEFNGTTIYDTEDEIITAPPAVPFNPFSPTQPGAYHNNGLLRRPQIGSTNAVKIKYKAGALDTYCIFWCEGYIPQSPAGWFDRMVRSLGPAADHWELTGAELEELERSPDFDERRR